MARTRTVDPAGRALPAVVAVASPDVTGAQGATVLALPLGTPPRPDRPAADGTEPGAQPGAQPGPKPGPQPGPQPGAGAVEAAARYGVDLVAVCRDARFAGGAGSTLPVAGVVADTSAAGGGELPPRLLLVGTGDSGAQALRRAGAALARAAVGVDTVATTAVAGAPPVDVRTFVEGFLLGAWTPERTGVTPGLPAAAATLRLLGVAAGVAGAALSAATTAAAATWRVRDLAAAPSTLKAPAWVADRAVALAATSDDLQARVLDLAGLTDGGFGGLLAVGRGSATEPRLVSLTYTPPSPGRRRPRHVVLVGKGITFDTGGLSIKPSEAMVPMKTDMAGAAVVLATVVAAAQAGVRHRVTAVLALAENAFGAASYRPGDVVAVWGGTTVEVFNTDAEGRMVLADALAWADATLDPDVLVDVATLTGAATLGLGRGHAALYTAHDDLAAGLEAAGAATGERVWRMPLVEEYRRTLDSPVADLRHIPDDRSVGGGSITAALFLREFAGRRRWAHLDIAGPARATTSEHEVPKGATGYGARMLLRWLQDLR